MALRDLPLAERGRFLDFLVERKRGPLVETGAPQRAPSHCQKQRVFLIPWSEGGL